MWLILRSALHIRGEGSSRSHPLLGEPLRGRRSSRREDERTAQVQADFPPSPSGRGGEPDRLTVRSVAGEGVF